MYRQLMQIIGKRASHRIWLLMIAMFFGSLLELLGVSLVASVCSAIVNLDSLMGDARVRWICARLGIATGRGFIIALTAALIAIYLFKALYLTWENLRLTGFIRNCRNDLSMRIFNGVLHWPYELLAQYSSAQVTNILYNDVNNFAQCLYHFLYLLTEVLVVACLAVFLLALDFELAIFGGLIMAPLLLLTRVAIKRRLSRAGAQRQSMARLRLKWVNQAVHGAKDIRISQSEDFFSEQYREANRNYSNAERTFQVWSKATPLCSETILIVAMLVYILLLCLRSRDLISFIPSLSALAMCAIRLMPACNRINSAFTQITYHSASLGQVLETLRLCEKSSQKEHRRQKSLRRGDGSHEIRARGVSFRYASALDDVFQGASLEIPAGASVGIMGASGAGKTTLVDILLGLLQPRQGRILIDGVDLRDCYASFLNEVAYIPQNTFLLDDTIRSNVAFGIPPERVNEDALWCALEDAALADMVRAQPDGLDTRVGEGGIRLSGGERQRVGIARALYRGGSVLVFDEATSALDANTEAAILATIRKLMGKKTMILISHRASAVQDCDIVYRVTGRRVTVQRQ